MIEANVKFNLCNVSETNDVDLNCFFIWFRCLAAPTTRAFNRLLGSGHGEMDQLLTLGKMLNSQLCPGERGFQLTDAKLSSEQVT